MFPSARTAVPYAFALLALLAAFAVSLIVDAPNADAHTRAHCRAEGRAVTFAQADTPDFSARLSHGDSVTLSALDAFALTEQHAYPVGGGSSQQFRCSARHGVDQFDEWRTRSGRIIATFDGVTFRARMRSIVAGWEA